MPVPASERGWARSFKLCRGGGGGGGTSKPVEMVISSVSPGKTRANQL